MRYCTLLHVLSFHPQLQGWQTRQGPFLYLITCLGSAEGCINFPHSRAPVGFRYSLKSCQEKEDKENGEEKSNLA